jgi:HlyD family type I secretion membrane fusion protein
MSPSVIPSSDWSMKGLRRTGLLSVLVIGVTFAGFGGWATIAPLSQAVVAPGEVKVLTQRKVIQHSEGGVIDVILVQDGDSVKKGEVLVVMDRTRAENTFELLQKRYWQTLAALARLDAELKGSRTLHHGAATQSLQPQAAGGAGLSVFLQHQQKLLDARWQTLTTSQAILREKINQYNSEKSGNEARLATLREQMTSLKDELRDVRPLLEKGFTSRARISSLERELSNLRGQYGNLQADQLRLDSAIAEAQEDIARQISGFYERAHEDYQTEQAQLQDITENMQTAEHSLKQTLLRAPVSGKIVRSAVHTEGGVIQPGEVLMEIVPDEDYLMIEARINPADVDVLQPDQTVDLQFRAHGFKTLNRIQGQLHYISADVHEDERSGERYFLARIHFNEKQAPEAVRDLIQPGLSVDVFIQTGQKTALAYLTDPLRQSMQRAWREQ